MLHLAHKKEPPVKKEKHLNACFSFFHERFKLISLSEKSAVYALKDTALVSRSLTQAKIGVLRGKHKRHFLPQVRHGFLLPQGRLYPSQEYDQLLKLLPNDAQ